MILYKKGLLHNNREYIEVEKLSNGISTDFKNISIFENTEDLSDIINESNNNNILYISSQNPIIVIRNGKKININDIETEKEFQNGAKIFKYENFRYYFSFDENYTRIFINNEVDSFQRRDSGDRYTEGFSVITNNSGGYILYEDGSLSEKFDSYEVTPPSRNDTTDSPLYIIKNGLINIISTGGKLKSNKFLPYIYTTKRCTKRGDESRRSYSTFLSEKKLDNSASFGLSKEWENAISLFNDKYRIKSPL